MPEKTDIRGILAGLKELYPDARPELNFSNPYETLMAVMLSAQCTDKMVNKVTPAVFQRYPTVQDMAKAEEQELYPMVKSCGFKTKAANMIASGKQIVERFDGVVPHTMEELTGLPGVGRKTANVVMAAAFGIPAIPVDTHVFRVSNRLGLAEAGNVEATEKQLQKNIPEEDWILMHHALIYHGRRVCSSQRPKCETCTLKNLCKEYRQNNGKKQEKGSAER